MLILEILMLIFGAGVVFASFYIADNAEKKSGVVSGDAMSADASEKTFSSDNSQKDAVYGLTEEEKERLIEEQREKLREMAAEISYETEDKLGSMSNEKIMGFSEYSDQILDKMEKNHAETVFLYDMLNEKEKEIKKLVHEADVAKTNLHDELLKEYQERKGYGSPEFEMSDDTMAADSGKEFYDMPPAEKEYVPDNSTPMDDIGDIGDREASEDTLPLDRTSLYDAEIARIEQEEKKNQMIDNEHTDVEKNNISVLNQPVSMFNQPVSMEKNKNDIISMYKEGKTVLEISKILSIGQGEVKLVIDMYKARKG